MFGWLRQRLDKEHCKLIYQNLDAATDGELKIHLLLNGEDASLLDTIAAIAIEQRDQLRSGDRLTTSDVEKALKINKDLRRLHDHNHRADRGTFDQIYAPLGGWKMYFERNGAVP